MKFEECGTKLAISVIVLNRMVNEKEPVSLEDRQRIITAAHALIDAIDIPLLKLVAAAAEKLERTN